MSGSLLGYRVIETPWLEEDGDPVTVRRPWRQRLFSRPWRPWVATRVVVPRVPYRGAVFLAPFVIAVHPETLRRWRESLRVNWSHTWLT